MILTINASAQADDGEVISDDRAIVAEIPGELPGDSEILEEVAALAAGLARAIAAPRLDDYVGPILFDGDSSLGSRRACSSGKPCGNDCSMPVLSSPIIATASAREL